MPEHNSPINATRTRAVLTRRATRYASTTTPGHYLAALEAAVGEIVEWLGTDCLCNGTSLPEGAQILVSNMPNKNRKSRELTGCDLAVTVEAIVLTHPTISEEQAIVSGKLAELGLNPKYPADRLKTSVVKKDDGE